MTNESSKSQPLFDRTNPEYLYAALKRASSIDPHTLVFGVRADSPPNSFDELMAIVAAARNPECDVSNEVDSVVEIIAACSDRDEIARALPFDTDTRSVVFVLPEEGS